MSDSNDEDAERRVLAMMKDILTRVARETAAPAGTRHVLSPETIDRIRRCLAVISDRQMQLAGRDGEVSSHRPHYPVQPNGDSSAAPSPKKNDES